MASEINFEILRSDKAIVGQKQHRTDSGVGMVQYVILADGFMIDCGHDYRSEQRAAALATIINAAPDELRAVLDKHLRIGPDAK